MWLFSVGALCLLFMKFPTLEKVFYWGICFPVFWFTATFLTWFWTLLDPDGFTFMSAAGATVIPVFGGMWILKRLVG